MGRKASCVKSREGIRVLQLKTHDCEVTQDTNQAGELEPVSLLQGQGEGEGEGKEACRDPLRNGAGDPAPHVSLMSSKSWDQNPEQEWLVCMLEKQGLWVQSEFEARLHSSPVCGI